MPGKKERWSDKFRTAGAMFGFGATIVAATVGSIAYFAPRGETNEKILKVEHLAGMTQKELNLWQIDSQIGENRRQLRQIVIEEQGGKLPPKAKKVFEKQKEDITSEIESLQKKRERIEKEGTP
jgi:hypothetical protein